MTLRLAMGHHHRGRRRAAQPRDRRERGAALSEAIVVVPVFMLLLMGILEIGLAMNDRLAVSSAARAGSRTASASGDDANADLYTVLNIAKDSSAIDVDNIDYVVIYKPSRFGEAPNPSCRAGSPQNDVCNVFRPADFERAAVQVKEINDALTEGRPVDPSKITFGCDVPGAPDRFWCSTDRKVTRSGTGPDYVGVYIRARHPWITKVFGDVLTLTDQSVIRLEPRGA